MRFTDFVRIVKKDEVEVLKEYLQNGGDLDFPNDYGDTPLMTAAFHGGSKCLELLLTSNDVNGENKDGMTALMLASIEGHLECMRILIGNDADLEKQDGSGFTVLHLTYIENINDDLVRQSPKALAAIKLLLDHMSVDTPDGFGKTLLMHALRHEDIKMVKCLISHKADVDYANALGKTPLMYAAAMMDNEECFDLILDRAHSVNAVESNNVTALMYAAKYGQVTKMRALIEKGADINARNAGGATVLWYATATEPVSLEKSLEAIKLLLSLGVSYTYELSLAERPEAHIPDDKSELLRQAEFVDEEVERILSDDADDTKKIDDAKKMLKALVFSSEWSNDVGQDDYHEFNECFRESMDKASGFLFSDEIEDSVKSFVLDHGQYLNSSMVDDCTKWDLEKMGPIVSTVNLFFHHGEKIVGSSELPMTTLAQYSGFLKSLNLSTAEKYSLGEYFYAQTLMNAKCAEDHQAGCSLVSLPNEASRTIASYLGLKVNRDDAFEDDRTDSTVIEELLVGRGNSEDSVAASEGGEMLSMGESASEEDYSVE